METGRDELGRFVKGESHPGFIDGESKTREYQKTYHKKWRRENREHLRAYYSTPEKKQQKTEADRIYRGDNKDELSEKAKVYYQKNREGILQQHKTPKGRYGEYKRGAKTRELEFKISFEEFMSFWELDCSYCGKENDTHGIDRVDNSKGYILDNLASCCGWCNKMKHKHSAEDFLNRCRDIVAYNGGI